MSDADSPADTVADPTAEPTADQPADPPATSAPTASALTASALTASADPPPESPADAPRDAPADSHADSPTDALPDGPADSRADSPAAPTSDAPSDEPEHAPDTVRDPASGLRLPSRLVFRIPGSALVGVLFLAMCASFVAVASPWLTTVYLAPIAAAVWVIRTRTVVDAKEVVVRRVFTRTVLPWSAIRALRVADKKWVRAVRTDGGEVVLPTVRTRHLPALSLISGGRIPDPTA